MKTAERWQTGIAAGILLVTGTYAWFAFEQWQVTERTVRLMERDFEEAQRPFVVLESVRPPSSLEAHEWLPFVAKFRNAGKGPATAIDILISYSTCDPGEPGAPAPTPTARPRDESNPRGVHLAYVHVRQQIDNGVVHIPALDGGRFVSHQFSLFPLDVTEIDALKKREQASASPLRSRTVILSGSAMARGPTV